MTRSCTLGGSDRALGNFLSRRIIQSWNNKSLRYRGMVESSSLEMKCKSDKPWLCLMLAIVLPSAWGWTRDLQRSLTISIAMILWKHKLELRAVCNCLIICTIPSTLTCLEVYPLPTSYSIISKYFSAFLSINTNYGTHKQSVLWRLPSVRVKHLLPCVGISTTGSKEKGITPQIRWKLKADTLNEVCHQALRMDLTFPSISSALLHTVAHLCH